MLYESVRHADIQQEALCASCIHMHWLVWWSFDGFICVQKWIFVLDFAFFGTAKVFKVDFKSSEIIMTRMHWATEPHTWCLMMMTLEATGMLTFQWRLERMWRFVRLRGNSVGWRVDLLICCFGACKTWGGFFQDCRRYILKRIRIWARFWKSTVVTGRLALNFELD